MNVSPQSRFCIRSSFGPIAGLFLLVGCSSIYANDDSTPRTAKLPSTSESILNPNLATPSKTTDTSLDKSIQDAWNKLHDNYGITPFIWYWGDFLANPSGGRTQAVAWSQLLEFGANVDFDRYGWKGGSFYGSGSYASGTNLSNKIGNTFAVSQAVVGTTGIAMDEVYLGQKVGENDQLQFCIGRMAAGFNFATLPIEQLSVNSATNGNPTALYINAPFNDMTGSTWAAFAKLNSSADTYTQIGVYQADPRANNPAYHGVDFSIRPTDGILAMAETGWTPTFGQTKTKDSSQSGYPGIYQGGGLLLELHVSHFRRG